MVKLSRKSSVFLAIGMVSGTVLTAMTAASEEFELKGRVVAYGSGDGLENVKVEVRKNRESITKSMVTKKKGKYLFKLDKKVTSFTLRFKDNRSSTKYSAAARFSVQNDANPKELDTQGW